jgi:hypothetical protein
LRSQLSAKENRCARPGPQVLASAPDDGPSAHEKSPGSFLPGCLDHDQEDRDQKLR